jgi:uncharacterized protein involved in response to NO
MDVAAKVVPTLTGIDVRRLPALWAPFALLNAGCALRVLTQILTDFSPTVFPIAGASGLLELLALAIWGVDIWRLMSHRSEATKFSERRNLLQLDRGQSGHEIGADQLVANVLDRHPDLLEVFFSFGFLPLKNPLMWATVARMTTIRRTCSTLGVNAEHLLVSLNAAICQAPSDRL